MNQTATPVIIDVEASAFGRGSYPIEIGVALEDNSTHCFLIRPEQDWERWDEKAEAIHHLSRETLQAHGDSVRDVAVQLNNLLRGRCVYSDAWGFDSSWIALLFHRAGMLQGFRINAVNTLLQAEQLPHWAETLQSVCEELNLTRHRASADALIVQLTLMRLRYGDAFELPQFGLLPSASTAHDTRHTTHDTRHTTPIA